MTIKEGNQVQVEAFRELNPEHKLEIDLRNIKLLAADFRETLIAFEKEGRAVTSDDLIYLAGKHLGFDPRTLG